MSLRPHLLPLALALAVGMADGVPPQDAAAASASRLDLRVEPVVDLLHWVRHLAGPRAPAAELEGLGPALEALRAVQAELVSPLAWGLLEGHLPGCADMAAVRARWATLPESTTLDGRTVRVREPALALADALAAVEPAFREQVWPAHREAIAVARAQLEATLLAHEADALRHLLAALEMRDPGLAVPVLLVAAGPFPGAVTHRAPDGRGVCFVAVADAPPDQLAEVILHEATHALDVATSDQDTVLQRLRARLAAAGLAPDDRALHDAWHTLMFVQAGETVRAVLDPAHVDYADARGLYERLGRVGPVVRDAWRAARRGELPRDEALERIVAVAKG